MGLMLLSASATAEQANRVEIRTDFSEADAALAILDKRQTGEPLTGADWEALFATEPYQRLKRREASLHRDFTDDDFKKFLLSAELPREREALAHTARLETSRLAGGSEAGLAISAGGIRDTNEGLSGRQAMAQQLCVRCGPRPRDLPLGRCVGFFGFL